MSGNYRFFRGEGGYSVVRLRLRWFRARVWAQDPSGDAPSTTTSEATDEMSENADVVPGLEQDDQFEMQMRGYSRRQVDEFVARSRSHARDLE